MAVAISMLNVQCAEMLYWMKWGKSFLLITKIFLILPWKSGIRGASSDTAAWSDRCWEPAERARSPLLCRVDAAITTVTSRCTKCTVIQLSLHSMSLYIAHTYDTVRYYLYVFVHVYLSSLSIMVLSFFLREK